MHFATDKIAIGSDGLLWVKFNPNFLSRSCILSLLIQAARQARHEREAAAADRHNSE